MLLQNIQIKINEEQKLLCIQVFKKAGGALRPDEITANFDWTLISILLHCCGYQTRINIKLPVAYLCQTTFFSEGSLLFK